MYWDRFDICEANYIIAHDWGIYQNITRLKAMHFRPSPLLNTREDLSDNGKEIYDAIDRKIRFAFKRNNEKAYPRKVRW